MKNELNQKECRVIGCLLEKQITTPEQYPLSLNAVTLACNQKTNRDPVMELSESEVQQILDLLVRKHFLRTASGVSSRVLKYEHRFCNSEFGQLKLSPAEIAVIATLFLRGAQTPGELRTRTSRLHEFTDVSEVDAVLQQLITREDGPLVVRLAREVGKRESRFMHLFSGPVLEDTAVNSLQGESKLSERVALLEADVAELKQQLNQLLIRKNL